MASGNKGVGVQVACLVYSRLGQMQFVNAVYAATTAGQHSGKKEWGRKEHGSKGRAVFTDMWPGEIERPGRYGHVGHQF